METKRSPDPAVRRTDPPAVRFSAWKIRQHQKAKVLVGLKQIVQLAKIDLFGNGPMNQDPVQKEYHRQIEIQVAKTEVEMQELAQLEGRGLVKPRTWFDSLILWVYGWATNEAS